MEAIRSAGSGAKEAAAAATPSRVKKESMPIVAVVTGRERT